LRVFAERHGAGIVEDFGFWIWDFGFWIWDWPDGQSKIQNPKSKIELSAHLDERLENVERKLLAVHDLPEVVKRRTPLLNLFEADVVLAQQFLSSILGHSFPPLRHYGTSA
jgi:hypothetical protein